jgi:glycosyltransferase involved in cell wall biosynthesis
LQRLAQELERRLDYVSVGPLSDPSAPIQYYLNYAEYDRRTSPLEFAFFTHIEESDEGLVRRFFEVAANVDVAVCLSQKYAAVLRAHDVKNVFVVHAGVDLEHFAPRIKIGVVGRTYDSGRKGEALLEQVLDLPGIDWHFTGEGWPGKTHFLAASDMPNFYRDMDFILVSSLYEGGPMCVVEALACGTPVIASPVGWVPEFPHIEFSTGDAMDLRRVLQKLVERKWKLRESVQELTWDNFAQKHDRLFRQQYDASGL